MGHNELQWVYLMTGNEGATRFLLEALLSDDPEDLGVALSKAHGLEELPSDIQDDLENLSEFREDFAEGMDDMTLADRHYLQGYDDVMTIDVLQRLNSYPAGRECLEHLQNPYGLKQEMASLTPN